MRQKSMFFSDLKEKKSNKSRNNNYHPERPVTERMTPNTESMVSQNENNIGKIDINMSGISSTLNASSPLANSLLNTKLLQASNIISE